MQSVTNLKYQGHNIVTLCISVVFFSHDLDFSSSWNSRNADMSPHVLQSFRYRRHPSAECVFLPGTVAPRGLPSLIDEAHMWAPRGSWQGRGGALTSQPGGLLTGTRRHSGPAPAKIYEAETDSAQNPSLWWCQADKSPDRLIDTHTHTWTHRARKQPAVSMTAGMKEDESWKVREKWDKMMS